jgi:aspartate kinase
VADAESIKRVAERVLASQRDGNEVAVVVTAMGDTTDELLDLAHSISDNPAPRELDMLLTTGERMSAALLAIAITELGGKARSYTGSQAGVLTTESHGKAKIKRITPDRLKKALEAGHVAILAGFQGVSPETKEITTLGRGASDTTAVALAAAISADYCEIFTDVDGIFTTDPRIAPAARPIPEIDYDEMLEMAATGAKVLHLRAVEYAQRSQIPVHVRSSFSDKPGTWVKKGNHMEEGALITGITPGHDVAKVTVVDVPNTPGKASKVFDVLASADINIDMIVQNTSVEANTTAISFTLEDADRPRAIEVLKTAQTDIGFTDIKFDDQVGIVSIIGVGMKTHPGVTATFFTALGNENINIDMISTSEIRISVVVPETDVKRAVQVAHTAFGLDSEKEAVVYAGTGR